MALPDQDQRTLPPTAKRIKEFRDRGEVPRSRDLTTVATLAGGAIVGGIAVPGAVRDLSECVRVLIRGMGEHAALSTQGALMAHTFVGLTTPPIVGALGGCLIAGFAQLGAPPVINFPKLDFSRLFNVEALTNLISPKEGAIRACLALAKVSVVLMAAYFAVKLAATHFTGALGGASQTATLLSSLLARVFYFSGGALAVLAAVDFILKKRDISARMRMTPEEVKREHKEQEGDPMVKRKRRQRMRELAKRRLKKAVESADIVLVNPTEYAVALRYRSKDDRAPRVVAKGKGEVAERIREMARTAGVPILAQPPLCRLIHKLVKEGREIPASLYQAVAEVMAYVYKLRGPRGGEA